MDSEKYYISFKNKIRSLRLKALTVFSLASLLRFGFTAGLIIIHGAVAESIFRLGPDKRIFLTGFILISASAALIYYVFRPARAWLGKDRRFGLNTLCMNVGKTYPEIKDRLLNAMQMYSSLEKSDKVYSPDLIRESLSQAGKAFTSYDFNRSIDQSDLRKRSYKFSLFAAVAIISFTFSDNLGNAFERIINPATDYPVPAAFSINVEPGDAEMIRNDPFTVNATLQGEAPESVSLYVKPEGSSVFEEYPMVTDGNGQYSYTISKVRNSFSYLIRGREQNGFLSKRSIDSPLYSVRAIFRPMARKLKVRLEHPAYSNLGSWYLDDNIGDITALKGTKARAEITLNKNVARAELRFDNGTVIPMTVSGITAEASFTVNRSSQYTLFLQDEESIENADPIEYRVTMVPDDFPFIRIFTPGRDADLNEDRQFVIGLKVSDDFGLSGLRLGYRLVDGNKIDDLPDNPEEMFSTPDQFTYDDFPLQNRQGMLQDVLVAWDLKNLQMFPEDIVLYFAEVTDNDRISGPKRSRSEIFRVRLPSIEELFDQAADIQEAEEQNLEDVLEESRELQQRLKEIANEMLWEDELDWEKKQETEEALMKQEEVFRKMEEIRQEIEKLAEKFEENDLLSAEVLDKYKELQEMLEELQSPEMQKLMQELQKAMQNANNMDQNRRSMENLRKAQEEYMKRVERTLKLLKRLQIEQMLDELVEKSTDILEKQQFINSKADSLRNSIDQQQGKTEEAVKKSNELGAQEQELASRMDNLKESLDRLLEKMLDQPDLSPQKLGEISEQSQENEIRENMLKMSSELFRQELDRSMESGERIKQDLSNLNSDIKEAREELNREQKQQILAEMRSAASDMLTLSMKQENLKNDSGQLTVNSGKFTEIADGQQDILSGMSRTISKLVKLSEKTFFLTPEMGKKLGEAAALMRSSIKRLEERNSKASTDIQKQSMQNLNEIVIALREAINNAKNSSSGMGFDQFMQQMEQLANQQEGLNQSTMEMFGQGSLTVEQQAAMQRLARDQEMIRKTLQELQEEMQGNSSVEQRLSQLGSDMEEVAKQLSDKNLTERTKDLQQRILSRMLDAQRSVHKRDFSKKRQSESAKDYRAVDPGALPDNLGENPQILQETMLKALKEGYSKDFEELIRKYFEKLNSGEIKKR